MSKVLKMNFTLNPKGIFTVTVDAPKVDLTEAEARAAMTTIMESNVFSPKSGTISGIDSATITNQTITDLI
ncbi:hypothetical protein KZO01_14540 [Kurthia zopfii]|uniref:Protein of uncharacterized function (DUF2922) n=1 Tax=Kurthia zopfii TaxID=1650 RepID=A0A2U3AB04_9BACL|nr:DUF2922 domain-containing protein [Kurthia zopfii]PWI21724.1 DUF2922 domain-containing protein [Kurthia zopfii]TDR35786.1 hypothetical protein DFR61_12816 [Kurthia zopfii]STX09690.1 Protein of uncharacterised function (DUF2922) [Kurthia zopfii]VEI06919.1 Protein of uncharacterised function (DUF2922) [Kurthia zopfii]GEK31145.1 hypothetical protein KZO01_14540 [Kurthia zopfii]